MLVDVEQVRRNPNPAQLLAGFQPDGQRYVLMARARGILQSAFPAGPPAPPRVPSARRFPGPSRPERRPGQSRHRQ
ncbi:hypothetical protein ACFFMP_20640 [Pseudoroseomonas cervicalis]|uniref:hypothetical protein n=1 Tax=Teichococcus cervicalis TaxID=204525 RepID=UPI0035ED4F9D